MESDTSFYIPHQVLKIYRQRHNDRYYIEIHDVRQNKNNSQEYSLGSGRPLQKKTMQRLLGSVKEIIPKKYFQGVLLNPYLLACEPIKFKRFILWYSPAGAKSMMFVKNKKLNDGFYVMPALLYFVNLDRMKVFAMKTNKRRPDQYTKLYDAPLFNQIGNNEFCWGSVKKDTSEIEAVDAELKVWEQYLWESKFSEINASLAKIYKEVKCTEGSEPKYPTDELKSCKLTIRELLEKHVS